MGKKTKPQNKLQIEGEGDQEFDEFSVDHDDAIEVDQDHGEEKLRKERPMKDVFNQILNEGEGKTKKIRKNKAIKVESSEAKQMKVSSQKDQKEAKKDDEAFKYISNKALEKDLKTKTLNGVLQVLNLISSHKKEEGLE